MDGIAALVEALGPDERERFSDLIEECRMREMVIRREAACANAALGQLVEAGGDLSDELRQLGEAGTRTLARMGQLYLRTVPPPGTSH
jgi:hypothetical protein